MCVDTLSDTDAVLGKPMKLTCIYCMKREEVKVNTRVDWYYVLKDQNGTTLHRTPVGYRTIAEWFDDVKHDDAFVFTATLRGVTFALPVC